MSSSRPVTAVAALGVVGTVLVAGAAVLGTAGDINERGFIINQFRKGFTTKKCTTELYANSIDANATEIRVEVTEPISQNGNIRFIDNGDGMNREKLTRMHSMYSENHGNNISMGVSGIGGKAAAFILSSTDGTIRTATTVTIFTHMENGNYIKAVCPWGEIARTYKYTGMIQILEMSSTEVQEYILERKGETTGTTIVFNYSETLHDALDEQFNEKRFYLKMEERVEFIFGKHDVNFSYKDNQRTCQLDMYDYFGGASHEYYLGFDKIFIYHYIDNKREHRYLFQEHADGEYHEYPKHGRGVSHSSGVVRDNMRNWKRIGFYQFTIGMRKCDDFFNENNVAETLNPFDRQSSILCDYDQDFLRMEQGNITHLKDDMCRSVLIRNKQAIMWHHLDGKSLFRASPIETIKMKDLRTELSYNTISCQDNPIDICMGIQEVKTQHSKILPTPLLRIMIEFKNRKFNQIKNYINNRITEHKATLADEQNESENEPEGEVEGVCEGEGEGDSESINDSSESRDDESIGLLDTQVLIEEVSSEKRQETLIQIDVQAETESVSGLELITMLTDFLITIDETTKYTGHYVDMYKMLQTIKQ